MERDFSPNLLAELKMADAQTVFILTGERGLGKHSSLREAEEALRSDDSQIVISIHPNAFVFSLWPIEEALLQDCPDFSDAVLKEKDGLNYVEQLTRYVIRLCSGQKRVVFFYIIFMPSTTTYGHLPRGCFGCFSTLIGR